jgi:hypothetical protein
MKKSLAHLLLACALVTALSFLGASSALAYYHHDRGGVGRAEGRYGVVFSLDEARPNPRLTPGALNPAVDQANIRDTICIRGYSRSIRPPEEYTERLKRLGIRRYGYNDRRLRDYEEDHLLCRVTRLLRAGIALENTGCGDRRNTRTVAQTAGTAIRGNGGLA